MKLRSIPRKLLPLLLLVIGLAGFMLLVATRPEQAASEARERAWTVAVQPVRLEALAPSLTLYGAVESPRAALLSAAVAADVAEVPAREGERLAAGQPVVVLDDRDARLVLAQRQAQVASEQRRHANDVASLAREQELLELAGRAVERAEDLVKRNAGSQALLDEARQAYERQALSVASREYQIADHQQRLALAQAQMDQARLDVERTRIRAPFHGRVAALHIAPGDRVRVGDPLAEIYDTGALEVRAAIPAPWLPTVRAALIDGPVTAVARIDGEDHVLSLERLSGRSAAGGAGVEGLLRFAGDAPDVALGRFAEVRLQLPVRAEVVALPHEALYGRDRIYRLADERMAALTVERVGEMQDASGASRVLVHSPALREGDRVIVTRLPNAMDGLRVTVTED